METALALAVFACTYLLNIVTITVGYHRGLAHGALEIHPLPRRLLLAAGPWVTGLDPKAWVVMHRAHHDHSDTPRDPHSPLNVGIHGILLEQLRSYNRVLRGLLVGRERELQRARDLDFEVHWLHRRRLWFLPYLTHALCGLAIGLLGSPLIGIAWFLGMMSHPLQGGAVNALGHAVGGRNFDTADNSRNNHLVSWLILGEGFQNNHHHAPASARFSYRRSEIDPGYAFCLLLERIGALRIRRELLLPRP